MKEFKLLLVGHWGLNITVEANSKEEALENAKKQAEEVSGPMNLTYDKQWVEGDDDVENCPDCGQLQDPPSGRFIH
jgi:hypothetical protein